MYASCSVVWETSGGRAPTDDESERSAPCARTIKGRFNRAGPRNEPRLESFVDGSRVRRSFGGACVSLGGFAHHSVASHAQAGPYAEWAQLSAG